MTSPPSRGTADAGASVVRPRDVRLACEACADEFAVTVSAYRARRGVVACPRCGCLDLVLLDPGDDDRGPREP